MKYPRDAVKNSEIRFSKIVVARKRRISRFAGVPWSERTLAIDVARRPGVGQCGVIFHRYISSSGLQPDVAQIELQRYSVLLFRKNPKGGIRNYNLFDKDIGIGLILIRVP